jgi:hypothetical protein
MAGVGGQADGRGAGGLGGVRYRDQNPVDAERVGARGGGGVQRDMRLAEGIWQSFHILPADFAAPAGAEYLQDGFLGREAPGEAFGRPAIVQTVVAFGGGENAFKEAVAMGLPDLRDAVATDEVDAVGDYWHDTTWQAARRRGAP